LFILSGPISSKTPCRTTKKFCKQTRTDHVQNIYWVLYLKGSSLPKNDIFQQKYLNV